MWKIRGRLEDISIEKIQFHLEKIHTVSKMLAENIDIATIAKATELEENEIIKMKKLEGEIRKEFDL